MIAAYEKKAGAKAPCICCVFRRAEALRSLPKSEPNGFFSNPPGWFAAGWEETLLCVLQLDADRPQF
jgi:hypothetical protein